ncbi:MAG TPA: hypothetical protein VFV09_12875 [Actinomycetota bacterium]|nr:hypothetical protein [Actinomycetota bacterium]
MTGTRRRLTASEMTLRRLHALLAVQSLVIVLGSVNRLGSLTLGYASSNQFLRWVDLVNLLPLPILSLVGFYLLKRELETGYGAGRGVEARWEPSLQLTFVLGVYLLGAGYGIHEVANYFHTRFCLEEGSALCRLIVFHDDEFSHWLFFAGFVMVNASVMLLQIVFPYDGQLRPRDRALIVFNSLFVAAGIFANLAFEEIGLDLYVVVLLAGVAIYLLRRRGLQPLLLYYSVAYVLGLLLTAGKIALS